MFLQFNSILKLIKLFDAPDTGAGNIGPAIDGGNMSKEDMIEFMDSDDNDTEVLDISNKSKDKNKGKSKSSEKTEDKTNDESSDDDDTTEKTEDDDDEEQEKDELKELEEELEEPGEDKLELVSPARRKDILSKYPNLFKDFPYLERAYYREQKYTELFPDIKDATTAHGKAETLDKFEVELIHNGNTLNILKAVKEENPKAFDRIADNYLPTLAQVDKNAYFHVLGNVIKHTIMGMVREAKTNDNKNLEAAAQILNQYAFGSSEFSPPTNLSRDKSNEENSEGNEQLKQAQKREQELVRTSLNNNIFDLNTKVNNAIKNTIVANIDPKESMTDYIRGKAIDDALEMLTDLISKDNRFKSLNDKLWQAAIKSNFSREAIDRVKTAHLSKAKTLLPTVIQKARNAALRGMGKRVTENNNDSTGKGPAKVERPRSNSNSGRITKPSEIPKGMRTLDFLNQD